MINTINHQFSSVAQLCPNLCDPMNRSTPGLPVHHQFLEFIQTHAHQVGDTIQPSLGKCKSKPQCMPMTVSCWWWQKPSKYCKVIILQLKCKRRCKIWSKYALLVMHLKKMIILIQKGIKSCVHYSPIYKSQCMETTCVHHWMNEWMKTM